MKPAQQRPLASTLLINSSRPILDDCQREALKIALANLPRDYPIAEEAEKHGIAPLVSHHLQRIGASGHDLEMKKLYLQYVQNRNRNRVQMQILENILLLFTTKNVDLLILKGGALCNLIYPDTALRPMSDLDILVKEDDAETARRLLSDMGFTGTGNRMKQKHHLLHALPEMTMDVDGVVVRVDLHINVFTNLHAASLSMEAAHKPFISFQVGDQSAYTLGYEEMLIHLCHHLITPGQPIKLISVTDIIGFAVYFADQINWKRLNEHHPFVINTLRLLDLLVPLPDHTREKAGFKTSNVNRDIGIDYNGWPAISFDTAAQSGYRGYYKLLKRSIAAPEWWLRLHYGYDEKYPIWFCRYILHLQRLSLMAVRWIFS